MYYSECPECGATLDPGEKCDCQTESEGENMASDRGYAVMSARKAMAFEHHIKQLTEQRDRRRAMKQARKKGEADTAATVTTSQNNVKICLNNYTKESEECQDVKSDTPGDTSGREVRQQGIDGELPVHLL